MFVDIVFPRKNELDFIHVAEKLGYSGLCFAYNYQKDICIFRQKIEKLQKYTRLKLYLGLLAQIKDVRKAGKLCNLVLAKGNEKNQFITEKLPVDILFDSEPVFRKDAMHFRSSGLNQVICKIAAKKKIIIGFDFNSIFRAENRQMIMGRVMQNVRLCRKYNVRMAMFSGAEKPIQMKGIYNLISLMVLLGLNEGQAKQTLKNTAEKIKQNIRKKSPEYIQEGVEIIK